MRLKDVLALPKDVHSLSLLKSYLNQPLEYHDYMAAFLHYIDILYYIKSYDILIQETNRSLQRYLKPTYEEMTDAILKYVIDAYLELEQYQEVYQYIQMRQERLPVLKKHVMYTQVLMYKRALNQDVKTWIESIINEDMPKETYQLLSEALLQLYLEQKLFEDAKNLHQKMVDKTFKPYVLERCQINVGLKAYDDTIDMLKEHIQKHPEPIYIYYLIDAYIQTNHIQKAINLEVEYEYIMEQADIDVQLKYYQLMLQVYESLGNNISINVYKANLNRLQAKQKRDQKKASLNNEPTVSTQQPVVQVTLESQKKQGVHENIEKIHDWFSFQTHKTYVQSYRDTLRADCIKLNDMIDFHTMVMYQKHDYTLYHFKKERLYDKKLKQSDIEKTFLAHAIQEQYDGFIEPHMYIHDQDVLTQKPYIDTKQIYVYQNDFLVIMFYFENEPTLYQSHDDVLRVVSAHMMLMQEMYVKNYQKEMNSDLFHKLLTHPHLVVRMYKQGLCTYSKAARRWFQMDDDTTIEPFINHLKEHDQETYKQSFRALYNFEEPSKVLSYQYDNKSIKEYAVVHQYDNQPLILSVFMDESSHVKHVETVKEQAKKDLVTGLNNLHAFYDDLPSLLQDKLTILKIEVKKSISFLYGQQSYLSYFKEFGFLTKKLIDQSEVYMFDGNHYLVTVPYNDIRSVNVMIKKYEDALHAWVSQSIPQEPFTPKVGIIRYPVVTTEKHIDTIMHYLDIALSRVSEDGMVYHFKYQDYEQDQFEQYLLDQMLHAIENQQFSVGFHQIIDAEANKVWMYESFAYIPHLDVDAKDIIFIAKKRKRLFTYDMEHIKQVLNMLFQMYQETKKYIKILIPVHIETLTHHMFISRVATLMKSYHIPAKVIDFNVIGDMKASIYHQLMLDIRAIGIGIHTSSLKVSLYYACDALHFDMKQPDQKMLDYLMTIQKFSARQNMTFVLRGVDSKEVKQTLSKSGLSIIEGAIYKRLSKESLFTKVISK
jgi:EAL domain-containing protein (putative c-di-GMP-specific phosphodiesterase class I)/GGDEF domain-containing protein